MWLPLRLSHMSYSNIRFEVGDAGIALLTVNRPEKLNALNAETVLELRDAVAHAAGNEDTARLLAKVVDVVDDVVDDGVEWVVAALATARLPPNPTPSAPAPTAAPIMILPSLDFNVSASSRSGDGPAHRTPARAAAALQRYSAGGMKSASRITPGAAGVSGREESR